MREVVSFIIKYGADNDFWEVSAFTPEDAIRAFEDEFSGILPDPRRSITQVLYCLDVTRMCDLPK